jgi:hypothetical protein
MKLIQVLQAYAARRLYLDGGISGIFRFLGRKDPSMRISRKLERRYSSQSRIIDGSLNGRSYGHRYFGDSSWRPLYPSMASARDSMGRKYRARIAVLCISLSRDSTRYSTNVEAISGIMKRDVCGTSRKPVARLPARQVLLSSFPRWSLARESFKVRRRLKTHTE